MTRYVPAFPRPVRVEDEDYLRFIRRQGCLLHSQIAAEAHHVVSRGAGGSDYRAVPLCAKHHREIHKRGLAWFTVEYRLDLQAEQLRLMEMFISALREGENLGDK